MVLPVCTEGRREIKDMERLILFPCNVGDTVYVAKEVLRNLTGYGIWQSMVKGEVVALVQTRKQTLIKVRLFVHPNVKYHERFSVSAIGKTVFLNNEVLKASVHNGC